VTFQVAANLHQLLHPQGLSLPLLRPVRFRSLLLIEGGAMKNTKLQQIATLLFMLFLSAVTWAAPSATSPYVTDSKNSYVQDATSQGIGNVNMILCIMNSMNVSGSGMLNKGSYIALIDFNKCKAQGGGGGGSSSTAGASASTNYMTALVDATRASNSAPMVANVWMSQTEQGSTQDIYVKVTATSSPADVPPFGVFRLDYIGFPVGTTTTANMNGFIDSQSSSLQYYETGQGGLTKLSMTAGSTTTGSGSMSVTSNNGGPSPTTSNFDFNFNSANFRRSDGTHDQCFDRALANANKSVWQYGTYNSTDGSRVDLTNPSFQVLASYNGSSSYGYASYYGINFQGVDVTTILDASPIVGLTVTDQRPANTTMYNLSKVGGKLTKWTQNVTTLGAMDGIPFTFFGDMTTQTAGLDAVTAAITSGGSGFQNWQIQWNTAGANFTVTGVQSCTMNGGCNISTFVNPVPVTGTNFSTAAISGWSDSFGGNINIPSTGGAHAAGNAVAYFTQSLVIPGSTPLTLYCLSNCPDSSSINAANAYTSGTAASPFNPTTATQWFNAPTSVTVTYTFGSHGLMNGGIPMTITNATYLSSNQMYAYGVQSGRLFDTTLGACTGMTGVCEPSNPTVYYTWQTGTNQWSQSLWLTNASTSAVVAFDPPQNVSYTVPSNTLNGPSYGTWATKTILLQFNGFGNLQGIPGHCVNPVDNAVVDCATPNVRYVPEFSIPDGATMTLGSTPLIVKALNEEVRLKKLGPGSTTLACSGMTLTSQSLPTASGLHNMASSTDAYYLGAKPTPSSSVPKVIDGVVQ
jgi:hypothetical protein